MLYCSHYSAPIIGTPTSISLSPPKSFKGDRLPFLAPTPSLLKTWKESSQDAEAWEKYKELFRGIIKQRWTEIKNWLDALTPGSDITLLCYKEKYCHRSLIGVLVQKHRPDCWGGEISDFDPEIIKGIKREIVSDAFSQPLPEQVSTNPKILPPVGSTVYVGLESGVVKSCHYLADGTQVQVVGRNLCGSYFLEDISLVPPLGAMLENQEPEGRQPESISELSIGQEIWFNRVKNNAWVKGAITEFHSPQGKFVFGIIQCGKEQIRFYGCSRIRLEASNVVAIPQAA